jgi:hypothetical protein
VVGLLRTELLAIVFPEADNRVVVDAHVHYLWRKLGHGITDTVRGRDYRLGRPSARSAGASVLVRRATVRPTANSTARSAPWLSNLEGLCWLPGYNRS